MKVGRKGKPREKEGWGKDRSGEKDGRDKRNVGTKGRPGEKEGREKKEGRDIRKVGKKGCL